MSGFTQFGFGQNDSTMGRKGRRLKMEKGQVARVSFLWWPGLDKGQPDMDSPTPGFVGAPRHYMKGVGYFINEGPEYTKIAGEEPKVRIATLIVKWPMVGQKIDQAGIQNNQSEVLYWVFDQGKYDEIKAIHPEWHFGNHDLTITCTDAGFQKMSFTPCRDNLLRKFMEKGGHENPIVKNIIQQGQSLLTDVHGEIGKRLTIDQLREKLGGGGGGGTSGPISDPTSNVDIDDALDSLIDD